jgi:hypothetical protein
MFGKKQFKKKYKGSHNFESNKPLTRSRLDKVIDILDAASSKDNRSTYKTKFKKTVKPKARQGQDWNATIKW